MNELGVFLASANAFNERYGPSYMICGCEIYSMLVLGESEPHEITTYSRQHRLWKLRFVELDRCPSHR
jgi:hypothetical protein